MFLVDVDCTGLTLSTVMKESFVDFDKLANLSDKVNRGR